MITVSARPKGYRFLGIAARGQLKWEGHGQRKLRVRQIANRTEWAVILSDWTRSLVTILATGNGSRDYHIDSPRFSCR